METGKSKIVRRVHTRTRKDKRLVNLVKLEHMETLLQHRTKLIANLVEVGSWLYAINGIPIGNTMESHGIYFCRFSGSVFL